MTTGLQVKSSDLAKAWSLVRSSDLRQMTLRVPSETFVKIQALELMFPQRTRNEMVSDLLATALDDFLDGLPSITHLGPVLGFDDVGDPVHEEIRSGPRQDFYKLIDRIRSESTEEKTKLEAVQVDRNAAVTESKEAA